MIWQQQEIVSGVPRGPAPLRVRNDWGKGRRRQDLTKLAAEIKLFKVINPKSNCRELQKYLTVPGDQAIKRRGEFTASKL